MDNIEIESRSAACRNQIFASSLYCVHRSPIDMYHLFIIAGGQALYMLMNFLLSGVLEEDVTKVGSLLITFTVMFSILVVSSHYVFKRFGERGKNTINAHTNIVIDLVAASVGILLGFALPSMLANFIVFGVIGTMALILAIYVILKPNTREPPM